MEIEYYLIQGKKRIRKYKPIRTQGEASAKEMFKKWFRKHFPKSRYELIIIK